MRRRIAVIQVDAGWAVVGALLGALWLAGCGDDTTGTHPDAAPDGGLDAGEPPDAAPDASGDAWIPPACPTFGAGAQVGTVEASALVEASGLVASRSQPGVLWAHNDAGDSARFYAMTADGTHLGAYLLSGAGAQDWEDLAIDDTYLYAADFGDNYRVRSYVTVYRVAEPTVSLDQAPVSETVAGAEGLELEYPDGAHNAETLLVDPQTGDLYIVTKEEVGDSLVFLAAAPLSPVSRVTLEQVGALPFGGTSLPGSNLATGGDVLPSGEGVIVKTYSSAYFWWRPPGAPLWAAFETDACPAAVVSEPQGEAVGFSAAGDGYTTLSEGAYQPLYFFTMTLP